MPMPDAVVNLPLNIYIYSPGLNDLHSLDIVLMAEINMFHHDERSKKIMLVQESLHTINEWRAQKYYL